MDFLQLWTKFRNSVLFRPSYLLLISLIAALSLPTGAACLALIVVPALTLLVPHWFGERRMKTHLLNGLFVLLVSTLLLAAIITPSFTSHQETIHAVDGVRADLTGGQVSPFRAQGGGDFVYSANLKSTDMNATNFTVSVRIVSFEAFASSNQTAQLARDPADDGNFSNGENFSATVRLTPSIHYFWFIVEDEGGFLMMSTAPSLGPFDASFEWYFGVFLFNGFFTMLLLIAVFYLVLMLYWWSRKAREVRGAPVPGIKKRDEGGGEFTCTNCGGDVSESDVKCPNCGAEFGEAPGGTAEPKA